MVDMVLSDENDGRINELLIEKLTSVDKRQIKLKQDELDNLMKSLKETMLNTAEKLEKILPLRRAKLECVVKCIGGRGFGMASLLNALRDPSLEGNHDDIADAIQIEMDQREALMALHDTTNQSVAASIESERSTDTANRIENKGEYTAYRYRHHTIDHNHHLRRHAKERQRYEVG
jgi:hypothetical protein